MFNQKKLEIMKSKKYPAIFVNWVEENNLIDYVRLKPKRQYENRKTK